MTTMNQATQDFIRQHQDDDVRKLAFLGNKNPEVDMPFALDQIRGRQIARAKLPRWARIEDIVYPPHISMEQCSSEQTALYKAELVARLLGISSLSSSQGETMPQGVDAKICEFATKSTVDSEFAQNEGTCEKQQILTETTCNVNEIKENVCAGESLAEIEFIDLTGGFGVDFSYIAARLSVKSMYVERQKHLCEAAHENFERLGLKYVTVKNGDGVEVLHAIPQHSRLRVVYLDPARRDDAGNKVVSLQDCTPDVTQLQDELLSKSDFVIIKLSPMLDWHRAVSELSCVREVHIVSVGNECKELLLVLSAKEIEQNSASLSSPSSHDSNHLRIYCVNDAQSFVFDEAAMASSESKVASADLETTPYLYEPNSSLMKAGCFGVLSERYGINMLSRNSHLYVSQLAINEFPGRAFRIQSVSSLNKKELKRHLQGITKANIAIRNFPLSVAELRKRLKLKDGGDTYIFATTLSDDSHVLLITSKLG